MSLGKRITQLREKLNMTQEELAKSLKVSRGAVSMWEIDHRTPDIHILQRIADFFDVSLDYLSLGRTDYRVADSPAPYRKQIPGDSVTTEQGRRIIDSLARANSLDNDDYDMIAAQVEKLIEYAEKKKHSKAPEKK